MFAPHYLVHLIEQFVREPAARYPWSHGNDFRFPRVKLKPD